MSNDKVIQDAFVAIKNVKWRDCEENERFQWYYAEGMHYVVKDNETNAHWFVKAKSPMTAYEYVKGKLANELK